MSPAAPQPGRSWRIGGWLFSLTVHTALVASAFFIVWTVRGTDKPPRPPIVVSFDNVAPAPNPAPDAAREQPRQSPAPAAQSPQQPAPITPMLSDLLAPSEQPPTPAPAMSIDDMHDMISRVRVPDVRFAGLGTSNARDIVYVVDASGSMISVFPQVLRKLESSLSKLEPTQRFQVILFGPGDRHYLAARHPADNDARTTRLIRATHANVSAVLQWARSVMPSQTSNPIEAMRVALKLDPDAVFVLSSSITGLGQWEPDRQQLLDEIDRMNPIDGRTGRRRVAIKAVQLLEPDPAGILREIARVHGGKNGYNFIPRQELLRK